MSTPRNPVQEVVGWASDPTQPEVAAPVNGTGFDLDSFIARHLVVRRGPLPWDSRGRKWELEVCPFNPEHIGGCAVVIESHDGVIGFKCQHHSCADKHWRDVRERLDGARSESRSTNPVVPTVALPSTITGEALFNRHTGSVRILLGVEDRPIMGDGLAMLAAEQKAGKSWLALQIAIAVAGGPPLAGVQVTDTGPVLYAALEEPQPRTSGRLRMLAPDGGPWLARLVFSYDLLPLMGGGAEQLILVVEKVQPRLLVIDTLTAVIKARRSGNSDVFRSQYQEVTRIRQIAEKYGLSVLLIHHTRKGGSDGLIESIAGTGGISAAVDTVWRLKRKPEGHAVLEVVGREVEECSFALRFERGTPFGWRFEGDGVKLAITAERREICDLLREEGGMTPKQIASDLGRSRVSVRAMLKRMLSDSLLTKEGTKYFATLSVSNGSNRESEGKENQ
jgi:DNA-binding NarL/FixJ family response regulator